MKTITRDSFLRRSAEFAAVKKRGVRVRSGPLFISCAPGQRTRLGMVVARRIGTAVVRNRVRRVMREFFRQHAELFPNGDCVIIPQVGASAISNDQLRQYLSEGLTRLGRRMGRQ